MAPRQADPTVHHAVRAARQKHSICVFSCHVGCHRLSFGNSCYVVDREDKGMHCIQPYKIYGVRQEVLEIFNRHVRTKFGYTLQKQAGVMGVQYRWVMLMIFVGSVGSCVDYIGALVRDLDDPLEVVVTGIGVLSWRAAGMPLVLSLLALLSQRCLSTTGPSEIVLLRGLDP
eukprot:TRINITY_DN20685_c0_g1_i27.p1 TRINITY_DN20685_c0_g1~~TRINITY_DN20685_c0_g1_i27.p1  ORF type:complete len:172 (-),score=4.77 TRINITY_DN20685_c0_g1_i27:734-1249(-)